MAKNFDRTAMIWSGGAAVGVIQTVAFKSYVDTNFGPIPFLGDYLPAPWGYWSTGGNIIIGGVLFALTSFTNIISNKSGTANDFLQVYGMTTLVGGIMNGIFYSGTPARARTAAVARAAVMPRVVRQVANVTNLTPTGVPPVEILA